MYEKPVIALGGFSSTIIIISVMIMGVVTWEAGKVIYNAVKKI